MENLSSHNWDFKAPSFMDFNEPNAGRLDDGADKFFDIMPDDKTAQFALKDQDFNNNSRLTFDIGPSRVPKIAAQVNEKLVISTRSSNLDITDQKENVPEVVKDKGIPSEDVKPQAKASTNIMTPSRLATWNESTINKKNLKSIALSTKVVPAIRRSASALTKTTYKLRARRSAQSILDEPAAKKLKSSKTNSTTSTLKHKRANSANFAIPNVLKRQPQTATQRHRGLTSEQREIEEIKELRDKVKREKQAAAESLRKIKTAKPSVVVHAKKTEIKEFHFETEKRLKIHPMKTRCENNESFKANDFIKGLRSHPNSTPFLSKGKRIKLDGKDKVNPPVVPVSMSKMISDFHKATPSQLRARSKNVNPASHGPVKVPRITESHTSKPNTFSEPEALKKVEKGPPTDPVKFNLCELKKEIVKPEPVSVFKAQPCPTFNKVIGVKEKIKTALTVPESPAFALKDRIKPKILEPETFKTKSYYRPAPLGSGMKSITLAKKAPQIKTVPFSFDVRDKEKLVLKEQKITELKESQLKVKPFKANLMPIVDVKSQGLPEKSKIKLTKPIAPQFYTDKRAALRVEEWSTSIDKEVSELRKAALSKTRRTQTPKAKSELKKTGKTSTEPINVQLASGEEAQLTKENEKQESQESVTKALQDKEIK